MRLSPIVSACLGLVFCGAASAADALRATVPASEANVVFNTARLPAGGLALTLRQAPADGREAVVLSLKLHTPRPSLTVTPRQALGADFVERAALVAYEGRNAVAANTVTLKRRFRGWFVYVDDVLTGTFPERFTGPVEVLHDAALLPAKPEGAEAANADDDVLVQRTAAFRFTDDFLVAEGDAEASKLNHWDKRQGSWDVHSVAQDVAAGKTDDARRPQPRPQQQKRRVPSADRSPNFYCVEGSGTNALLLAGYDFYDRYGVAAAVHAGEGENGLVFLETPDRGFFAFTATPRPDGEGLRFTVWRTAAATIDDRTVLAQCDTDLPPGQWHRLAVKAHDDRIVASVNGIEVANLAAALPPGGRFGLYANGPVTTRFDDVAALSHEDLDFPSAAVFRAALRSQVGDIERRRGRLPVALEDIEGGAPSEEHLALTRTSRSPALAVFGAPLDQPHVVATAVQGEGRPFEAALVSGWQGPDLTAVRFVVRQTPTERIFRLERAVGGLVATGEVAHLSLPLPPSREPLQLMLDATGSVGLRAYADGRLVLVAPDVRELRGASGVAVLSSDRLAMALPLYRSERRVFSSKTEKTAAFATDPFMRHWATPEGEWIKYPGGPTWFKGDLFGAVAVHLPWKEPSTLVLGVPEGTEEGPYQVVAANGQIRLVRTEGGETNTLAEVSAADLALEATNTEGTQSNRWFSVHLEDHALWARSGVRTLFMQPLTQRLPGRRMRIEGMEVENLAHSRVDREGIADFLFAESLYEWTLDGGQWEIVNRFQCDPRWSHMNGQNADSLAALWARYEFTGDFCVDFYAGMRHGWYDRPGDINLTVLGATDAPSSGYTFVCTGWDVDESQLNSRLFRNGEELGATDKYMVPRVREGSVRRGYNPLLGGGRDVHGAWYYTQLRRAGEELQVSFDHQPALTVRDPAPLKAGGLGIWTYRNSIVVARVRMAAEGIRPKRFAIQTVDPKARPDVPSPVAPWPAETASAVAAVAKAAGVSPAELAPSAVNPRYPALPKKLALPTTTNGLTLAFWTPDAWVADDSVSNPRLDWRPTPEAPDTFVMTARDAGGSFKAEDTAPAVPLRQLAGWRFETARTPDAQYNFGYTVGRMANGEFEPAQSFFHRLSGTDETRGPALRSGATDVPPAASGADPATAGPWTSVSVWLPAFPHEEESLWVRVDGFGNLQPSDVQQGLHGNPAGAAYAVRRFAPILLGEPVLDPAGIDPAERAAFAAAVATRRTTHVHTLPLPTSGLPLAASAVWVLPPSNLGLTATWSSEWHDAVDLHSEIPWPVRQLKGLPATVNGRDATVVPREGNHLLVLIPRDLPTLDVPLLQIDLATSARRPVGWGMPLADRVPTGAPVLLALESPTFAFENFETRRTPPLGGVSATLRSLDPTQGQYVRTANAGTARRLMTPLAGQTDLVRNPVVQFRYRGEGMTRVSLRVDRLGDVAVSETPPYGGARIVRGYNPGITDRWRTWSGVVTDDLPEQALQSRTALVTGGYTLQSCDNQDQTGRYSTLSVDDIIAGPAVGPHRPLSVTPRLFDLDRDGFVEWAVLPGVAPFDPEKAEAATGLPWQRAAAGTAVAVPFDGLPDGIHHVLFRAASPRGRGPVADVPFLLDSQPIAVTHTVENVPEFGNGTRLALRLGLDGGSLPQLGTLHITCNGEELDPFAGGVRAAFEAQATTLRVNWPLLLSKQIARAADGDTLTLRVDGLADGADNTAEATTVPIPIRFADDKTPPTLRDATLSPNIAWMASWTETIYTAAFRTLAQTNHRILPATADRPAVLQIDVGGPDASAAELFQRTPWNVERFPYLALRVGFAKLPPKTTPSTLRLTLLHRQGEGQPTVRTVDLLVPTGELPKEIRGVADWREGKVSELTVNVRDLLRRLSSTDVPGQITALRFDFVNAVGAQFQIQQAVILAPWGADDAWTLQAYDASGVDGLVWQNGGRLDGLVVKPASVTLPAGDADWLRLRVRDRAGNLTYPMPLPLVRDRPVAPGETAP